MRCGKLDDLLLLGRRCLVDIFVSKPDSIVAIEGNRDISVDSNTLLDRLWIFVAEQNGLPRKNMLWFVEVAVGYEWQTFEADWIEYVIPISYLPRVEQRRVFVNVLPKIKRVFSPMGFELVRMRRDR